MTERGPISRIFGDVLRAGTAARDVLAARLPRSPHGVVLYDSFGREERVLVHGRALRDAKLPEPSPEDPRWKNLVATLRRADADPIPHAVVRVRAGRAEQEFVADDEGFFQGWMSAPGLERLDDEWGVVRGQLVRPEVAGTDISATARVLSPAANPELLVISDIDDTVLQSSVTNLLAALRTILLENAHTRLPFPGVAAFYRALRGGASGTAHHPLFYVSSSPWNVYDVIRQFLEIRGIPAGPLLLRDVDLGLNAFSSRHHHTHKREMIRRVLTAFPDAPAILIGDSGQQDPEIYRDVVHDYAGRVRAVYIRDVNRDEGRTRVIQQLADEVVKAGSSLVLAADTLAAASHAAEAGLIHPNALDAIRSEQQAG